MRIISKKVEYYDCIQSYGQDKTCTWVRDIVTIVVPKVKLFSNSIEVNPVVIGFCGKLYPALGIDGSYYYNVTDFENRLEGKYQKSKAYEKYRNPRKFRPRELWYNAPDYFGFDERSVQEFFNKSYSNFSKFFTDYKCPVFIVQSWYNWDSSFVTLHGPKVKPEKVEKYTREEPLLTDLSFYRVFDNISAFQQIHQYLMSGEIGFNEPFIPVPDDKTMAQIKGFDKYSFRKDKET